MPAFPPLFLLLFLSISNGASGSVSGPIEPAYGDGNQCLQAGVIHRSQWPSQFKRLFAHFQRGRLLHLARCDQSTQQQWQVDEKGITHTAGRLMVKGIGRRFIPQISRTSRSKSLYPVFLEQGHLVFERKNQRYCITSNAAPFFDIHPLEQCLEDESLKQSSRWLFALPPDPGDAGLVGLTGIDSNRDGIRDDVERFIEKELADSGQAREVARKLAVIDQEKLNNANNKEAVIALDEKNGQAVGCLYYQMENKAFQYTKKLKALTFNTEERIRAWNKVNSYYSGEELYITPI